MMLSLLLLEEIQAWPKLEVSGTLYHGCRDDDHGIDIPSNWIAGNKWFSKDPYYAGEYAWHFSRPETGTPYRLELRLKKPILAVTCPARPRGKDFPWFLAECFPKVPCGYGLSRHFQNVLAAHLSASGRDVIAYLSHGGKEILIPTCESHTAVIGIKQLPRTKIDYITAQGLIEQ